MSKEVKQLLKAKKQAFQKDGRVNLKVAQAHLKSGVRKCKEDCTNKRTAQTRGLHKQEDCTNKRTAQTRGLYKQEDCTNKRTAQTKYKHSLSRTIQDKLGAASNQSSVVANPPNDFANDLNRFYYRFNPHDFETERNCVFQDATLLPDHTIEILKHGVASGFKKAKTNEAARPDRITGKLLKECCEQLSSVFPLLFQLCFHCCSNCALN